MSSTVEDKLRQALEATASEIPAAQVPALTLAPRPARGRSGRSLRHAAISARWRRGRWVAAVAATAAVAVVIGLAAAISGQPHRPRPVLGPRVEFQHGAGFTVLTRLLGPAATVGLRTAPVVDGGTVPAYYVVVNGSSAEVLATATGTVLATLRLRARSAGNFAAVSGAADDRTFVLATVRNSRTELYLLRLNPHAGTARLTALRIAVATSGSLQFAGLALSPDGSKLAVAVSNYSDTSTYGAAIWVYDLATGSRREWQGAGKVTEGVADGPGWLSWAADDKTLAFDIETGVLEGFIAVRLLDTAAPGTDLSRSRLVLSEVVIRATTQPQLESPLLTADGRTIVLGQCEVGNQGPGCPSMSGGQGRFVPETLSIDQYSARTGHRIATVYQRQYDVPQAQSGNPGPPPSVLWTNPSGTLLIVSTGAPVPGKSVELGILRDGTFTPLRVQGTALTGTAAW